MKTTLIIASLFAAAFSAPTSSPVARRQAGGNLQTFTGALGGIAATPVEDSGNADRPFSVKGDTFANLSAALARSCDQQFNACANAANGGDATLSLADCSAQQDQCTAGAQGDAAAQGNAGGNANANAGNANANAGNANNNNANNGTGIADTGNANGAACTKKHRKN
ncbi:hypothetical protein NX059_001286 [Plenodomus lindquistii]|nr:hypothetical protein NX059_001286 [Plenodomus lindquistii]